jgi:hypothetical protein
MMLKCIGASSLSANAGMKDVARRAAAAPRSLAEREREFHPVLAAWLKSTAPLSLDAILNKSSLDRSSWPEGLLRRKLEIGQTSLTRETIERRGKAATHKPYQTAGFVKISCIPLVGTCVFACSMW